MAKKMNMDEPPTGDKLALLKKFQRFFVCVAVALGIFWLYQGAAKTHGEFYFRMVVLGGAFVGAGITTILIARKQSEK